MARRSTGKGKPRPVSYGYWREAASGRIHGQARPACAVEREVFPCRLTRPQWESAVRCACAVWWGGEPAALFGLGLVNVPLEHSAGSGVWSFAVERSGELAVVWATYNTADGVLTVQAPDDGVCWVCGLGVRDDEGGEESVVREDGVVWCASCARPALSISYGSTVVARVEGPASASAVELAALRVEVRKNPFLVTSKQIEDASRARLHRRREGLPCPLCEVPAGCACTARQLAVWASRQLALPMEIPAAPSIGAKSGSQGVLW